MLFLLPAIQEPAPALETDRLLRAEASVHLKIVPLAEAVAALGNAAHVTLETSPSIRELKTTVLVRDIPVGRTMARLADVMRCRWQKEGETYRLVQDTDASARQKTYLKAEATAAKASLEGMLAAWAELGERPYAEVNAERIAQEKRLEENPRDAAARQRVQDLSYWAVGRVLGAMGAADRQRLVRGEVVVASTQAAPGVVVVKSLTDAFQKDETQGSDRVDVFLRLDPSSMTLQTRLDPSTGTGLLTSESFTGSQDDSELAGSALGKELTAWNEPEIKAPEARRRCAPNTLERPSVWWSNARTASDRLEWLHESTGLPIIAMASRAAYDPAPLRFDGTVAQYLAAWRRDRKDLFHLVNGILMMRPYLFWSLARREAPETALRVWESTPEPLLDAYAALATRLADDQAESLRWGFSVARVDPSPLRNVRVLRLWDALGKAQRKALLHEEKVPFRALSPTAQRLFGSVIDPFGGASLKGSMAALLGGGIESPFALWGLKGKTKDVRILPPNVKTNEVNESGGQNLLIDAVELLLGLSEEDSIRWVLPLRGAKKREGLPSWSPRTRTGQSGCPRPAELGTTRESGAILLSDDFRSAENLGLF